jgi:hypothetical protein
LQLPPPLTVLVSASGDPPAITGEAAPGREAEEAPCVSAGIHTAASTRR